MKAVRYHQTGTPDVLRLEDVPKPTPGPGEVVIAVRAAALNRLDLFLRGGLAVMPGFKMPHVGGFDVAGDVAAVGADVSADLAGKPVVLKARVSGPGARGKLDIIGISRPGGFAEYVLAPASAVVPKPEGWSYEQAAAFPCCHLTAYYGLVLRAAVRPGETVLVHAGGSGAGAAAVQVARLAGASVIATVGRDASVAKARELLGADRAVNYRTEDVVKSVQEFTRGRGVDVVFDPIWGSSAAQTVECLGPGGRWIVLGMVGGQSAEIVAARIMFKEIAIRGIVEFYATDDEFMAAMNLAYQDRFRPIVDRVWPLDRLADAQRQMESGEFFGKIVVKP